ncbi:hypothetical protein HU200_041324 [Digitaria exilis]|uniref:Reverse transcriptase zinc-binding domain-containing protein n=1 Tax=Digitaria exilis TaxID=1010633 RepID=A0A835EDV8_9POAL|nr:hypothetical protein HU200_041324 [Digitaria exilis]
MDRLNTKDLLQRRNSNVQSGINCVLCHYNLRETRDHLFFDCVFARHCWSLINFHWTDNPNIHDRIVTTKQGSTNPFFKDIALIAASEIWKLRNAVIFDDQRATHQRATHQIWTRRFRDQMILQSWRFREDKRLLFFCSG